MLLDKDEQARLREVVIFDGMGLVIALPFYVEVELDVRGW